MQHLNRDALKQLEARMVAVGEHRHDGRAVEAFLARLDNLLPAASISTTEYAIRRRLIRGPTGDPVKWTLAVTPYAAGPQDAADMPGVRIVAVQGPARFVKTVMAENKCMKHWTHGPSFNVLWYMQTKDDLSDYVDERFEWMLENHEEVAAKINWQDPKNGRFRKMIGDGLVLLRPATLRTTRGKAAPIIIADEIDAYEKRVRNGMKTLINNRQREFGSNAIAIIASHPDAGAAGIAGIIADGLRHLWHWLCPGCGKASSPCQAAEHRMTWNVPKLLERSEEMERSELLDMIELEARLICPHCQLEITEEQRLPMSDSGAWLQPHQTLEADGTVKGEPKEAEIMGFVGHAFMSHFVNLGKLARGWASAWLTSSLTGDDIALKEETVKSLGEEYEGADAEEKIEGWKVVKARLGSPYSLKEVPPRAMFGTAFVDVQGDRFEVRVIFWDLATQSWLVDAFPIKQWPGFDTIDPANRLLDWDILEDAVLNQVYVTQASADSATPLYLPIAKTLINAAGGAGVSNNARVWLANLTDPQRYGRMAAEANPRRPARPPVESWRVQLFVGSASKKSEVYGKPYPILVDDAGKALAVQVKERAINVHQIKRMIAKRMKIETDGMPGRMHLPFNLNDRYTRELVAERLINDEWIPNGRNETWDGWVACEAARALLQPNRPGLWVETPIWAKARPRQEHIIDVRPDRSYYDRLAEFNREADDEI